MTWISCTIRFRLFCWGRRFTFSSSRYVWLTLWRLRGSRILLIYPHEFVLGLSITTICSRLSGGSEANGLRTLSTINQGFYRRVDKMTSAEYRHPLCGLTWTTCTFHRTIKAYYLNLELPMTTYASFFPIVSNINSQHTSNQNVLGLINHPQSVRTTPPVLQPSWLLLHPLRHLFLLRYFISFLIHYVGP